MQPKDLKCLTHKEKVLRINSLGPTAVALSMRTVETIRMRFWDEQIQLKIQDQIREIFWYREHSILLKVLLHLIRATQSPIYLWFHLDQYLPSHMKRDIIMKCSILLDKNQQLRLVSMKCQYKITSLTIIKKIGCTCLQHAR